MLIFAHSHHSRSNARRNARKMPSVKKKKKLSEKKKRRNAMPRNRRRTRRRRRYCKKSPGSVYIGDV